MRNINPQAWAILLPDEKTALNLQYSLNKSSWEAGEVMNKSHYKYLEIKYRAEAFLKLFTEYFQYFNNLIPDGVTGDARVLKYMDLVISQRYKVPQALTLIHGGPGWDNPHWEEVLTQQMKKWEISENPYAHSFYQIIKEFDRWNNHRILPVTIQEPSAFKRRNKKVYLKHIKITASVPGISVSKISQILGPSNKGPRIYLPLITDSQEVYCLAIRDTKPVYQQITSLNLYVFKTEEVALEYINLLYEYITQDKKTCNTGLIFWPKYRDIIKRALNYEAIHKIVPSRRYLILALNKLEFY